MNKPTREHMELRLMREFRLMTEHGDRIELTDYQAAVLADIIAEYVADAIRKETDR